MRILVTGATGFVGSRLLERLAERGDYELYSLQRYVTGRDDLAAGQDSNSRAKIAFCDMRDSAVVKSVVREIQPEVVVHLASISPVSYSYDHPNEVMDVNLLGTINLAESCR
jgi:nucleoside-diphosphate-sugar epimerase